MATMVHTTPEFNDSTLPSSRTKRALVLAKEGVVELREKAIPTVGPNDALLRVTMTTICGTDVHILKGEYPVKARSTPSRVRCACCDPEARCRALVSTQES